MKKLFLNILLIGLAPAFSFAQKNDSPTQMDVMMKMGYLRAALLSKDSFALSALLSDDVTYGHTSGLIQTKAALIRDVMSGEQTYNSITPSDINIRVYDNTAIVTMKSAVTMNYQDKPLDFLMYVTLVWIKKNKWQLVARQSVKQ